MYFQSKVIILIALAALVPSSTCLVEVDDQLIKLTNHQLLAEPLAEVQEIVRSVDAKTPNEEESEQQEIPLAKQDRVAQAISKESVSQEDESQCSCRRLGGKLLNENFDTYTLMNNAALKPKPGKTYKLITVIVPVEIDEPRRESPKEEPCVEERPKAENKVDINPENEALDADTTELKEEKVEKIKPKRKRAKRDVKGKQSKKQQGEKKLKSKSRK